MSHARFTEGSTMRHICVMSLSGATGITALFLVDMLDLFFLSLLGEKYLAAAVGYAGTILFLTTSIGIGLSIASAALVSKAIGAGNRRQARQYMINVIALTLTISAIVALMVWLAIPWLLTLVGAQGEVHSLGEQYLRILIPSMPVVAVAMGCGAGLRALGDARLSMSSTLAGGAVNAALDPVFIFLLGMGIEGAAVASVFARFTILAVSAYGIFYKHRLFCRFKWPHFTRDWSAITRIAMPAMFTNLATPVSALFVTRAISDFGNSYVAGYAIIGRIIPVAFGVIFALSGAVGPIVGQNYGAHLLSRVQQSLKDAYLFASVYILAVSLVLLLGQNLLVSLFNAREQTAEFVQYFCTFIAISFLFNGWQFIANASFNNLGKATWSTWLNWGKATLGTLPFIALGSELAGAEGILMGQAVGGILFALAAVVLSFQLVRQTWSQAEEQKQRDARSEPATDNPSLPCSLNPLSSECAQMGQIAEEAECENQRLEEARL